MGEDISSKVGVVSGLSFVVLENEMAPFFAGCFRAPTNMLGSVAHRKAMEYAPYGKVLGVGLLEEVNRQYEILHTYYPEYSERKSVKFPAVKEPAKKTPEAPRQNRSIRSNGNHFVYA